MPGVAAATITDFNNWTLLEDPPHANFSSSVDSSSQVTLAASGALPSGTDIAYQSFDGFDAAGSTGGWAFDPNSDFSVSIGFDLSFTGGLGGFTIGFGIGEDRDGTDSAGVILASMNGSPAAYAGVGRENDNDVPAVGIGATVQSTGRFIVTYDQALGDVTVGVSTDGDDVIDGAPGLLSGMKAMWDGEMLGVSFFARGDNGVFSFSGGGADAVFTDLRVLSGSAIELPVTVPEPSAIVLAVLGVFGVALAGRRRRRRAGHGADRLERAG